MPQAASMLALMCLVTLLHATHAAAQGLDEEERPAEHVPVSGFWPDLALTFGGGIGLEHSLYSNVMARLRVGALLAAEPFFYHLGVTGEVGGLAEHGYGLEAEINHIHGLFLRVGMQRVAGDEWMSEVGFGIAVAGLEWHHRWTPGDDDYNALMLTIRLPIGIWWFLVANAPQ